MNYKLERVRLTVKGLRARDERLDGNYERVVAEDIETEDGEPVGVFEKTAPKGETHHEVMFLTRLLGEHLLTVEKEDVDGGSEVHEAEEVPEREDSVSEDGDSSEGEAALQRERDEDEEGSAREIPEGDDLDGPEAPITKEEGEDAEIQRGEGL